MDNKYESQQELHKHMLDHARTHPEVWKIKTINNGTRHLMMKINAPDKIWIINEVGGKYSADFIPKDSIDAIIELMGMKK